MLPSSGSGNQIGNDTSVALDGDSPEGGTLQHCAEPVLQFGSFDKVHELSICCFS